MCFGWRRLSTESAGDGEKRRRLTGLLRGHMKTGMLSLKTLSCLKTVLRHVFSVLVLVLVLKVGVLVFVLVLRALVLVLVLVLA